MYSDVIWLRSTGCVIGINLDYLNDKIRYFNGNKYLRENADFWEWLQWEEGEDLRGYDCIWNDGNTAFSRVLTIRGGYHR